MVSQHVYDFTLLIDKLEIYPVSVMVDLCFQLKPDLRPGAVLLLADEDFNQIYAGGWGEEIVEDGRAVAVRWQGSGDPIAKTPEYINMLVTDRETVGDGRPVFLAAEVGSLPHPRNLKSLFDAAPDRDKAVTQLIKHE